MHSINTLFPTLSNELVQNIEQEGEITQVKAGSVIMRTGQYIKSMILVLNGKIKIYREDEEGNEFFMYYLLPGQACAISMICTARMEKSQVMAKVVEDAELLMIPLEQMDKWMAEHKSWYEFVVDTYRTRFEDVLSVIDHIAFRSMDERLEFYLQRHAQACNCRDLQLSHQEIATELNSSREVISRLLKKMEQRGLVKLHRNHIELLKLPEL
jgi:CRP/FNR family transcriptional regulator